MTLAFLGQEKVGPFYVTDSFQLKKYMTMKFSCVLCVRVTTASCCVTSVRVNLTLGVV
jgi:hypothetical protein